MGDTPMPDAAEAPPAGEKATLDRNVSSDEDSDEEEIGANISASLEVCTAPHFPSRKKRYPVAAAGRAAREIFPSALDSGMECCTA